MVLYHDEPECLVYRLFCEHNVKVTMRAHDSYNQNMTVATVSLELLILLQPDIAVWYVCQACIFCTTDSFATKLGGSIDYY